MGISRPQMPPRLRAAIAEYLSKRSSAEPVSIADIRKRVRYAMPDLSEPDDALGEMIAAEIIAKGGDVKFDGQSEG